MVGLAVCSTTSSCIAFLCLSAFHYVKCQRQHILPFQAPLSSTNYMIKVWQVMCDISRLQPCWAHLGIEIVAPEDEVCPEEAEIVDAANLASLIEVNEQQEDERKPLQRHQAAESVAGTPPEMVPESIKV